LDERVDKQNNGTDNEQNQRDREHRLASIEPTCI
jgi:hypothetical protein